MAKTMNINVKFEGIVTVTVPENIPTSRKRPLAGMIVLAKILATTDNPDAPEGDACENYQDAFELTEQQACTEWDSVKIEGVSGAWNIAPYIYPEDSKIAMQVEPGMTHLSNDA